MEAFFSLAGETLPRLKDILVTSKKCPFCFPEQNIFWNKYTIYIFHEIHLYYLFNTYFPRKYSLAYVYRNLRPSHISAVSSFGQCHQSLEPVVTPRQSELTLQGVCVCRCYTATMGSTASDNFSTTSCPIPVTMAQHTQYTAHSHNLSTVPQE